MAMARGRRKAPQKIVPDRRNIKLDEVLEVAPRALLYFHHPSSRIQQQASPVPSPLLPWQSPCPKDSPSNRQR
ncbi:unnamed protein product [Amoebophrya sp. A120]|nr:unnamed protein product [Amoebophrya sp. A120]|eukprot:GSA120T00024991001.1